MKLLAILLKIQPHKAMNTFAMKFKPALGLTTLALVLFQVAPASAAASSVYLEDLTSPEVRTALDHGTTTILIPIGGTEQNGPHMTLGKHNYRVQILAGQIAQQLGNALVAPVVSYVPEGSISPPVAHMRFAGTISISDATFEALLDETARSFKQHGFRDVVFLGDHGGYQKSMEHSAAKLNHEWSGDKRYRATALRTYYEAAQAPFSEILHSHGLNDSEIGMHAGSSDTSLMLATDPHQVHKELLAQAAKGGSADGVYGDPRKSSAELGQLGVQLIVKRSVLAIQDAVKSHGAP